MVLTFCTDQSIKNTVLHEITQDLSLNLVKKPSAPKFPLAMTRSLPSHGLLSKQVGGPLILHSDFGIFESLNPQKK